MRAGRHDLVALAAQHQERAVQPVDRRRRDVHQLDQTGDRIDPGRLDEQRVGAERAQHLDVVGRHDLQPSAGQLEAGREATMTQSVAR